MKSSPAPSSWWTFFWRKADQLRIYVFLRLNGAYKLLQICQDITGLPTLNANIIQELLYILHDQNTLWRSFIQQMEG